MNAKTQQHRFTCQTCGTPNYHQGRRDLIELIRRAHAMLEKAVTDADHRRNTRDDMPPLELVLYESETAIALIEGVQAAASIMRRDLFAVDGGCLKCLDALRVSGPGRCTVCGAKGPGCGPDGSRCKQLGCPGSIA